MIILGIFTVCINTQSFGDLVKLLASSLSRDSDGAVLVRMGQHEKKPFCLWISTQQPKFWILRNWVKNCCFPDIWACVYVHKCQVWRRASCTHGTINGLGFFLSRKACLNIPGENSTCCFNKTCLCFPIRARSADTSLNPKAFLRKPIHRAMQKSAMLPVPCRAESSLQCLFTTCLNRGNSKWGLCFQWQQRCCFNVIAVFPVPGWLFRAGCAVGQRDPVFGQEEHCWEWNSFHSRRGGSMPTCFRSIWGYWAWY